MSRNLLKLVLKGLTFIIIFFLSAPILAQDGHHMVYFKDKSGTPYSITDPTKFLSQKSIDRRSRQNIDITEQDLPVNASYVNSVADLGARVLYTSKWFNGVLVEADATVLNLIQAEPYVLSTEYVAPMQRSTGGRIKKIKDKKEFSEDLENFSQLSMIGLDVMHEEGFTGEGITIGVFDSGYKGVNVAAAFTKLRNENRITYSADFVGHSDNIYQYDSHGSKVLSIMAADLDMTYRGGAFGANYQLYVTEDIGSEYRVEEYNWLFAAERADSAGVDIINSSLGYNLFDNEAMNYKKSQVDGETAIVSKAAALALSRGMVVVTSAGNDGDNSWKIITPPADVKGVLAVGAVSASGSLADFSSVGPTADGRLKPDVVAPGAKVSVIKTDGMPEYQNGTSFSAPLITGLAAGVWQAFPGLTSSELYDVIINSGSRVQAPNNQKGYGIPHYIAIKAVLNVISGVDREYVNGFYLDPNPTGNQLRIKTEITSFGDVSMQILDPGGKVFIENTNLFSNNTHAAIVDVSLLSAGLYIIKLQRNDLVSILRFVKW